jgi:hypothetical protein
VIRKPCEAQKANPIADGVTVCQSAYAAVIVPLRTQIVRPRKPCRDYKRLDCRQTSIRVLTCDMPFDREQNKHQMEGLAARGVFIQTSSWKCPAWRGMLCHEARYAHRGKPAEWQFEKYSLARRSRRPKSFRPRMDTDAHR